MQLTACRPFYATPPPLPPMPLRFEDPPPEDNYLLDVMAAGFPPTGALTPPRIASICRKELPNILGNFFPQPGTPIANEIAAYRALLFALRMSSEALPDDPALQPFLQDFCDVLEWAGRFAAWIATWPAEGDATYCDAYLLPRLRNRQATLLEGGYSAPNGGHAAGVYLWPMAQDETLLVVADRKSHERTHPEDRPGHLLPLVYRFKTSELTGDAGRAFFCALMALQHRTEGHDLAQFYALVEDLARRCHGVVEVGFDADGGVRQALRIAGQSALKSDTCIVSSGLTVLHFGLHAAFGTLDPCADPARREAVRGLYKQLKEHCRSAVLVQFMGALKQVRQNGDPVEVAAYEAALARTRDFLAARASRPHMAGHLAALRTV